MLFTSVLDGDNPINRFPRRVRWGHASYGLTGNVLSYEISLPMVYGPYEAVIYNPTGGWQVERPVINFGPLDCQSAGASGSGEGLESLPRCVARGAVCLSDEQTRELLAGLWQLRINGFNAIGQILPVDSDHDSIPDFLDHCPNTAANHVTNADGCSLDDLCPCDGTWRNQGDYLRCLIRTSAQFQRDGLLAAPQRRALLREAIHSDCGKQRERGKH